MATVDDPIITSLLDNDLYKFSMQNAVFRLFPDACVEYSFIDRGQTKWSPMGESLKDQIQAYCELQFAEAEIDFLRRKCPYLSKHYLEWLQGYRPDPDEVSLKWDGSLRNLTVRGPWYRTILWEVPLMAMISEQYYRSDPQMDGKILDRSRDIEKARRMGRIAPYSDFGTRRRFSRENHERIVQIHKKHGGRRFQGTSNVWMAMKYDLDPRGTMAHEWIMFHAAAYGYRSANEMALRNWYDVYKGELGIALTDTYTSLRFFRDMDVDLAQIYDGLRHDSGDPIAFAYEAADFYIENGIQPSSKKIVFSDGLTVDRAEEIYEACKGVTKPSFGIGTHFTNDLGVPALNMVIKMTKASLEGEDYFIPTVKLSDVSGKHTGSKESVYSCKIQLGLAETGV